MNYFLNFLFHIITYIKATEQVENNYLCPKNNFIDKLRKNFFQSYIDFVQSRIKDLHEFITDVSTDDELNALLKSKNIVIYNDLKLFILNDKGCGYFYSYLYCFIVDEWYGLLNKIGVNYQNSESKYNSLHITLSNIQKILFSLKAFFFEKLKGKYIKDNENNEIERYWYIYDWNFHDLDEKIQKANAINKNKPVSKFFYDPLDIHDKFMIFTSLEKTFKNPLPNDKKIQIFLFTYDISTLFYQFLKNFIETKHFIDVIDIKKFLINIITTLQELSKNKIEVIMKLRKFCKEHKIILFFDRLNVFENETLLNYTLFNYLGLNKKETEMKDTFRLAMEQINRYSTEIMHGMFSKIDFLDYPNRFENLTEDQKIKISISTFGYPKEDSLYLQPLQEKKLILHFQIQKCDMSKKEGSKSKMQSREKEDEMEVLKA